MSQASLIPEDTSFVGDLEGDGDLTVAGRLEGPVRIRGALVVEPSGEVRGPVHARSVTVRGIVAGDTRADEHIRIEDGGCVVGDVTAPRVHVVEGARLRGQMHMEGDASAPETPEAVETAPHEEDARRRGPSVPGTPQTASTGAVPSGPEPPRLDPDVTDRAAASTAGEGSAADEGPSGEPSGRGVRGTPSGPGTRGSAPPMRMPSWGKRRRAHRRHATETG